MKDAVTNGSADQTEISNPQEGKWTNYAPNDRRMLMKHSRQCSGRHMTTAAAADQATRCPMMNDCGQLNGNSIGTQIRCPTH